MNIDFIHTLNKYIKNLYNNNYNYLESYDLGTFTGSWGYRIKRIIVNG